MAVQNTGLKYTSEGIDQFVSNLKKAQLNLAAFTNSGKASSLALRQAAADVRVHANSLSSMIAGNKAMASAQRLANTAIASSSPVISRAGQAANQSGGFFSSLGQKILAVPKALLGFNSAAGQSFGMITGLSNVSQHLSSTIDYLIRRVILLTATYAAVGTIKEWIKTGFEETLMYDGMRSSLEALIAREQFQTGQVASMADGFAAAKPKAQELTEWVEKLGILSIFESDDIKNIVQLSMAVGISTENAKALTTAMVDWGSVFQATPAKLEQVTHALTDMFTKGKVQSEELTRQLANHGIPAWQYLSEALGVTTAEAQKMVTAGLVPANVGIKAIVDGINKDFGGAAARMSTSLRGLTSSLDDLKKIGLREFFISSFEAIQPYLERFVAVLQTPEVREKIRGWGVALGETTGKVLGFVEAMFASGDPFAFIAVAINSVIPGFYKLYSEFGKLADTFGKLAKMAFGWGENIGSQLAAGVVQAATYIVQALNYIGQIITSWLAPGSPPKLLPDLPQWGAEAMNEWIGGWTDFDQGIFSDLQGTLKSALENMASVGSMSEEGIIPALLGGRESLAKATREIEEFGDVSADTLSSVNSWVNSVDPNLQGLIDSYFEWEKASLEVKDAQEDLEEVNKRFEKQLKGINKAYNDALSPLRAQKDALDAQEEAIRDQERLRKAQETASSGDSTEAERALALIEIQQIQNKQQMDAIESRQEAEISAVEAQQEAEVAAAEERLSEAERQQELAQEQYDNKVAQIELQREQNALIAEQTKLMESQAKAAAGGGGGGGGPGGPKIPIGAGPLDLDKGPLKDLEEAFANLDQKAKDVRETWAGLKSDFDEARASIESTTKTLEPLTPLAAGIGIAFSSIAAGGIVAFIAKIISGIGPIGLLITAGSLLYQAWTSNFMGIQEVVASAIDNVSSSTGSLQTLWTGTFLPAIQTVSNFFSEQVAPVLTDVATDAMPLLNAAAGLVASIFTNVVVPAGRLLWSVFSELIWPIIATVAGVLSDTLLPALTVIVNFISQNVLPVFRDIFNFISDPLIPLFTSLAGLLKEVLRIAFEAVSKVINEVVIPGLSSLWNDYLVPVIDAITGPGSLSEALDGARLAFDFVSGVVSDFIEGLGGLEGIINSVIGWIDNLKKTLEGVHVPSDLEQHSPSALEQALIDVGVALQSLDTIAKNSGDIWGHLFNADNLENLSDKEKEYVEEQIKILQELPDAIEEVSNQAEDLIRSINDDFLKANIDSFSNAIDNLHSIGEAIDDINSAREESASADSEIADAQDDIADAQRKLAESYQELQDAMAKGDFKAIQDATANYLEMQEEARNAIALAEEEIAAARERKYAADVLANSLEKISNYQEELLRNARADFLKSIAEGADPVNAQKLFDLRSKHITDLAELDRRIAMETDERKRSLLLEERDFLMQQQKIEMDLLNSQNQARVNSIEEAIQKIADAFANIKFPDLNDMNDGINALIYNLTDLISKLGDLQLPDWLTPGSPTPLEIGIRGITSAMSQLANGKLPVMKMQLDRTAMISNPVQSISNSYSSVYSPTNQYNLTTQTNNSPNQIFNSFEIMRSMYGRG